MTTKHPLLIFPFNGNAIEAIDCLGDSFELIGFMDDDDRKHGTSPLGVPVFSREAIDSYPHALLLAVPGSPSSFHKKKEIIQSLNIPDKRFAQVIHPLARISHLASLGKNTLVMAGVVITSNAVMGDHTIILPNTVIHHDVVAGEYNSIGSNVTIAGRTQIGSHCYIGSGTSIINDIAIGDKVLIGMGTNVIRSVPSEAKVAGNPGRLLN